MNKKISYLIIACVAVSILLIGVVAIAATTATNPISIADDHKEHAECPASTIDSTVKPESKIPLDSNENDMQDKVAPIVKRNFQRFIVNRIIQPNLFPCPRYGPLLFQLSTFYFLKPPVFVERFPRRLQTAFCCPGSGAAACNCSPLHKQLSHAAAPSGCCIR